jgi:uncharacterized protein (TIGR03067 family)
MDIMMKLLIALALVGLSSTQAVAQDGKERLAKLEGRWRVTSFIAGGMPITDKSAPSSLIVKDGKATFFAEEKEIPPFRNLTLRLGPAREAKAIDLIRDAKSVLPCLYDSTGDDLRIAMPMIPEHPEPGYVIPRPASFDSKDKPVLVFIMKRIKD